MFEVILKKKADRAAERRHPWIFSGAVDQVVGGPQAGDVVRVMNAAGGFLAWGHFSPESQIRVRLLDWSPEARIDLAWWASRLKEAVARRSGLAGRADLTAWRVVFSESDLLPGLIVDNYAGFLVLQALTSGVDRLKSELAGLLAGLTGARGVFERSDAEVRKMEGLNPEVGVLWGEAPGESVEIMENGRRFLVDLRQGQKTGFFLDQRDNRAKTAEFAAGKTVLDCFAHSGAFSVYAAGAGAAAVDRVESSREAAALMDANLKLNGFDNLPGETIIGDVFKMLRLFRDQGRTYDLIILDPPKFAPTKAQVPKAARGYKDINLLAFKLLRPGGVLATFSCSQGVEPDLFQKIIFGAALDAGREAQIIARLTQGEDHPTRLSLPESEYLKGLICRVI
ncbi:MAG: class I SAM-dependent rRNA methyltransferase [Pseudomonadota bacterium]